MNIIQIYLFYNLCNFFKLCVKFGVLDFFKFLLVCRLKIEIISRAYFLRFGKNSSDGVFLEIVFKLVV